MPNIEETLEYITSAETWDERVARFRQVPAHHGTNNQPAIYARLARRLYVPYLAPDYAYVHRSDFYAAVHFQVAYRHADELTDGFTKVAVNDLAQALLTEPLCLLALRSITGLTKSELAASTGLVAEILQGSALSASKIDSMERRGTVPTAGQATVLAETIDRIMDRSLFGDPPGDLHLKQDKPDTINGWTTVSAYAPVGCPIPCCSISATTAERSVNCSTLLQSSVAISSRMPSRPSSKRTASRSSERGHTTKRRSPNVSRSQSSAPDFVVYDKSDNLRALLECKGANDGGTARDKALRFAGLRDESARLGGVPLVAVLGGLGWTRVNDTLGPVVRDCDGRVFSVSNLHEMTSVAPFSLLIGAAL